MSSKVINFHDFTELTQIIETKYTSISTANKVVSPCRQYIFKTFLFNMNSNYQKKFLEVFHQISCHKNQYLQCYKYYSLISSQSLLKPTFSMKYISNKTLEKILNDPILLKQFPLTDAIKCLFAVAQGMYYLHSRLICHGDLCPSNIIVDDANQCYLVDFGLYPIKKLYYNPNDVFTEIYKDPKMVGEHPVFGNDIYSYGILICQICQAYFPSKSYKNLRDFVKNFDARKYKNLPPFFIELIKECLNENVNERPSFLDILNSFQESKHIINSQRINKIYNDFTSSIYAINLSDLGDPFASIKAGDMYSKGKLVEKDAEKALEYYKKAALLKNSEGQNNYGVTLQDDFNKKKRGTDFLRLSAEQGNIHGMYNYGVSLIEGEGVKKDYNRGLSFLKKAADAGYSSAQSTYAFMILNNKPTKEQINEGLDYLKMAMNQGNADAYYTYGVILYYGQVVPLNMKLSMEYFKIAADLGDVRAMKEYADGNYEGKGMPKNIETALTYYQKAYEKGDNSVKKNMDEISQKLMGKKANRKKLEKEKNQDDIDLDNSESSLEVTSSEVSNQPSTKSLKKSKAKEQNLKSSNTDGQEKKQQSPLPKMPEKEDETTKKKQQSPLPNMLEKEDDAVKKKQQLLTPKMPEKEDDAVKKKQQLPTPKMPEKEDDAVKKKQPLPTPKIHEKDDEAAKKKQQITKSPKNTQQRTLPVPKILEKEDKDEKEKQQPTLTEQKEPQFTLPQLPKLPTKEELEKVKKQQPATTKPVKKNSSFSLLQISEQQDEKGDSETSKKQSSQKKHSIDDLSSTSSSSSDSEQDKTKPKQTSQPARRRQQLPLKSKQSSSSESSESEQPFIAPLPTPTLLSQLQENSTQEDDDSQNNENEPNLDQPPEELIKQGDRYQQQNLLEEALQCYEKAAERGYPSAYLKCAKVVNPAIEKELKYYEAAIGQKVPGAFGEMRKVILKHFTFNKNKDEMIKYAKYFEKYDDFSDAASLYRRARDKENFSVAYEKAKKNIQSIRDGLQQFHFAQLLEGKKENDLALSMYQKALKNGVVQAEENIKSLKIKLNQAESFS